MAATATVGTSKVLRMNGFREHRGVCRLGLELLLLGQLGQEPRGEVEEMVERVSRPPDIRLRPFLTLNLDMHARWTKALLSTKHTMSMVWGTWPPLIPFSKVRSCCGGFADHYLTRKYRSGNPQCLTSTGYR